jgi:flavorubredoxin
MKKEIAKGIYAVGVSDWNIRNFHGYLTKLGSSYNSYLVVDDKITLIDTVKAPFAEELLDRISEIVEPEKIDYLICNHVEMDHSGSMPKVLARAKNATVITTATAQKELALHYDTSSWKYQIVKSGDSIKIGQHTYDFVLTPMVHWPDNMVTYNEEEKILFSNDAFGQHIAHSEVFADELPMDYVLMQAKMYYANIVMPYSTQVVSALTAASKLDIKMIAPSHGMVFRKDLDKILSLYDKWSHCRVDKKAVIVYDSMWHSTESMAEAIAKAFEDKGYCFKIFDLKQNHISEVITDCLDAQYICVGSPTLNKNILPTVASFLTYLQGLITKGRKGILFGSYGWAGLNMKYMQRYFDESFIETVLTINDNFVPSESRLKEIQKLVEEKI